MIKVSAAMPDVQTKRESEAAGRNEGYLCDRTGLDDDEIDLDVVRRVMEDIHSL